MTPTEAQCCLVLPMSGRSFLSERAQQLPEGRCPSTVNTAAAVNNAERPFASKNVF